MSPEFTEDFHQRLAKYWPEPRGQLHHGGWRTTKLLFDNINPVSTDTLVDLCCGEGETTRWASDYYDCTAIGLDIVPTAIKYATQHRQKERQCFFVVGDVFHIPLSSASVDIVFGQDPDGIAHMDRVKIFKEIKRILVRGGIFIFHHWVLQNAPENVQQEFDQVNADMGFASFSRISQSDYINDIKESGLALEWVSDVSSYYHQHLLGIQKKMDADNVELDAWSQKCLKLFDSGYKIGSMFKVVKR